MSSGVGRQFGLFDFFSVFVPGATLLIGVAPFLPRRTPVTSLGAVVPLLVGGVVVGRFVYGVSAAAKQSDTTRRQTVVKQFISTVLEALERPWLNESSHRERFEEIVTSPNPTLVAPDAIDDFYELASEEFNDDTLPDTRQRLNTEQAQMLYTFARSTVHADGRGWSRTFQAIHAFYRTMWFVSLSLSLIYLLYGLVRLVGLAETFVGYQSFVGASGIPGPVIVVGAVAAGLAGLFFFSEGRKRYRDYYIRYLIADFVVIHRSTALERSVSLVE